MKTNQIKLIAIAVFVIAIIAVIGFQTNTSVLVKADGDIAADYKKNCAACHTAAASKFYDTAKPDTDHVQIILKGKKGEKPPYMPGFEAKGVTAEQAQAYAVYMRKLRTENTPAANTPNTNTANVSAVNTANTNAPVNVPAKVIAKADAGEETIASYKKNCMACHSAVAAKFFDITKEDAVLEEIVLKGMKGEKPPYMPEFATKGVTAEQAKALVAYMRQLKAVVK